MTKRIVIGGLAGGIVMFLWGAISHMALQLGDAGLSQLIGIGTASRPFSPRRNWRIA